MSDDAARQQAQREVANNQGAANTNNWQTDTRLAYQAERDRAQKEASEKKP